VDPKRNKLLLAAEDHGTVQVFDLMTGAQEKTLTTFGTPHAVLYRPRFDRFVITYLAVWRGDNHRGSAVMWLKGKR
jgi:hypothetical protein